jgi:hypothetical protein
VQLDDLREKLEQMQRILKEVEYPPDAVRGHDGVTDFG